jgi:hypothetical protein
MSTFDYEKTGLLSTAIPFELHLTTSNLAESRLDAFLHLCERLEAKPILIELSKGDIVRQPMLSKVIKATTVDDALFIANDLSATLQQQGFAVKRLKIEVPAKHWENFKDLSSAFSRYFEWHGKVQFIEPDQLLHLCEEHNVHLSRNALKNEYETRFITLRDYGDYQHFQVRIDALKTALVHHGRQLVKQEAEYCLYDDNTYLDHGWLLE